MKTLKSFISLIVLVLGLFLIAGCAKTKIELSFAEEEYSIEVGDTYLLSPEVKNEDDEDYKLEFSSLDEEIATYVDGVVTAVAIGETTVKVALEDNAKVFAEAKIIVVEVEKFTVTFETDGGSEIADVIVEKGQKVTAPKEPTKAGHTFKGWFADEALKTEFNYNSTIKADTTVFAKWDKNNYSVTFEVNGGSNIAKKTLAFEESLKKPTDPIKDNHELVGWYLDADLTEEAKFPLTITKDITLYAKWERVSYNVSFESNGGSLVPAQVVSVGEKLAKPADPTKADHRLEGWYLDEDLTERVEFPYELSENIVLYAKWELAYADIFFETNGGSLVPPQQLDIGTKLEKPTDPTRANHELEGWYLDEDLTKVAEFPITIEENITLYAKWSRVSYNVKFDSDGGTPITAVEVKVGELVEAPEEPTKDDHLFVGWFIDEDYETEFNFDEDIIEKDITLYAKWELDMSKFDAVEFEFNGGNIPITALDDFIDVEPISSFDSLVGLNPVLDEYYIDGPDSNHYVYIFLQDKNRNMSPSVWQNRAFLNRNEDGFFVVEKVILAGSGNENPPLDDYEYVLYAHSDNADGFQNIGGLSEGQIITFTGFDITSQEEFDIGKISINIYPAGTGNLTAPVIVSKGSLLPTPVKEGSIFKGWYETEDFSGEAITESITGKVYAKWEEIEEEDDN